MDEKVVMTADALEALMQRTAEEGARRALAAIGLEDAMASNDVRDLRGLLGAFRQAKRTIWQTVVKFVTIVFLAALLAGLAVNVKLGVS